MNLLRKLFGRQKMASTPYQKLVQELIQIGKTANPVDPTDTGFARDGGLTKNPRAIAMGNELYRLSGGTLTLMQRALEEIRSQLGDNAAAGLSITWHDDAGTWMH